MHEINLFDYLPNENTGYFPEIKLYFSADN